MIGVVGGGFAGLSAAYRLSRRGYDVRVFEAADDLGGLAATYETRGDPVEVFYHHLSRAEETILELLSELGLGDRLEWRVGKTAAYVDGVVHPLDRPWEILAYPELSLYDTVRLGALVSGVDLRGFPLRRPRFDAYDDLAAYDDVPAEAFLREHATDRVYERFWKPLLEAKFGARAGDVSAAWVLGRIRFRGERDLLRGEVLGYLEGGFPVLVDALVDAVGRERVDTGARVVDLGVDDGAVRSLTVERGGGGEGARAREHDAAAETPTSSNEPSPERGREAADGGTARRRAAATAGRDSPDSGPSVGGTTTETYDVDAVVLATMPHVLEDLTGYACDIDFQGTICSVFGAETSLTDTYWLNLVDDAPFGVFLEHTNFVPPERYGGEHLYYLASYVQDHDSEPWTLPDAEIERRWLEGVSDLFPAFDRNDLNWIRTARNPRTAPVYERGYLEDVVPYDLADEVADGLYYAGMASGAQYPERSLNGAIESGFACADRIVGADS